MEKIFEEIAAERIAQDKKWGGPVHDDQHNEDDWAQFIHKHTRKAAPSWSLDKSLFRQQMIRVAALAVAAVEWVDRRMS